MSEFERYYRTDWSDADGDPIMNFKMDSSDDPCLKEVYKYSDDLRLFKESNYGSLIGFVLSKKVQLAIKYSHDSVKLHIIDTIIAKRKENSKDIEFFYVGSSSEISPSGRGFCVTSNCLNGSKTKRIEQRFKGSKIYFSINDAVISDADDIFIPDTINNCEKLTYIRKQHKMFYSKYNRKPGLWYLDNRGGFNILLLSQ